MFIGSLLSFLGAAILVALGAAILLIALLGSAADAVAKSKGASAGEVPLWFTLLGFILLAAGIVGLMTTL